MASQRIPPHDARAEAAFVCCVLLGADMDGARLVVQPEDLYDTRTLQPIYAAACALHDAARPVDLVTVVSELTRQQKLAQVGGPATIAAVADTCPVPSAWEGYARIVRDFAALRRLMSTCAEVYRMAERHDGPVAPLLDVAEGMLLSVGRGAQERPIVTAREACVETLHLLEATQARGSAVTGLATGLTELDNLLGGLQRSDLVILAARPGVGKSALALCVALHAVLEAGEGVLFFSVEMPTRQLIWRAWAIATGMSVSDLRVARVLPADMDAIIAYCERLEKAPLYLDTTGSLPLLELRAKARRQHRQTPLGLVVVDYLQLVRVTLGRGASREQEVATVSASLKALAKELDVPVLALAQLNRQVESRADKRPQLSDLRESGSLEQDADVILFLYRDELYDRESLAKGTAEIIIAKQRNGPLGTVRVAYQPAQTRFTDLHGGGQHDDAR